MKISIVMAVYNGTEFLPEQLNSILNQTRQADEVIIADDCSPDSRTPMLVRHFIETHELSNWQFIENSQNVGWKKNFISLLQRATGDYIFLSDQDDIWEPSKLDIMSDMLRDNPSINVLCSNYKILNQSGHKICSKAMKHFVNDGRLEKINITPQFHLVKRPGCTYGIKNSFAQQAIGAWQEGIAHDKLLWIAALLTNGLYRINYPLIQFRRHANNASGRGSVLDRAKRLENLHKEYSLIKKIRSVFQTEMLEDEHSGCILEKYEHWMNNREKLLSHFNIGAVLKGIYYWPYYATLGSYVADFIPSFLTHNKMESN